MNAIIPANFGPVAARFAGTQVNDDLSSGIQSSFGLIGYKGKVWSIRYRGEETQLMREDGDGPRGSIEVVILSASKNISKIWYEQGYVEGSNAAPDCFSNNGVTPEPTSAKPQCASCALCPHNQWGSRITPAGKQGKACSDSKRLAVVPQGDINNEVYGGPMLLRVPAASLQDLAMFGGKMNQMGYPYFGIATRISFDPAESFPKFVFNAIRPLSDQEADLVLSMRDGHQVNRILSESEFGTPAPAAQPDPSSVFEQPAQQAQQPQQSSGFGATAPVTQQGNTGNAVQSNGAAVQTTTTAQSQAAASAPQETEAERELRELKAKMAALEAQTKAAAQQGSGAGEVGNGAATMTHTAAPQQEAPAPAQASTATASPSDGGMNMASDFEMNLDNMLNDLLPPSA